MEDESQPVFDDNGEIVGYTQQQDQKPRRSYGRSYYMGMIDRLNDIMFAEDMTNGDRAVLGALLLQLDFDTPRLNLNASELARRLGMNRVTASRSITKLVSHGALIRVHENGNNYAYYMDPHVGFRGKQESFEHAQRLINNILWDRLNSKGTE